tara:strand:- start:103 stop:417 length:315 start_codon:yes stop_codon:yes gene_type:complete
MCSNCLLVDLGSRSPRNETSRRSLLSYHCVESRVREKLPSSSGYRTFSSRQLTGLGSIRHQHQSLRLNRGKVEAVGVAGLLGIENDRARINGGKHFTTLDEAEQ